MKSLEEKLQLSINKGIIIMLDRFNFIMVINAESLLLKRIESLELSLKEKTGIYELI